MHSCRRQSCNVVNLYRICECAASQRKRLFTRPLTIALDQRREGDPANAASVEDGVEDGVEDDTDDGKEGSGVGESEDRNILERI